MAISVTSTRVRDFVRVIRIEYKFTDLERGVVESRVDYVNDVEDLPTYFTRLNNENHIIDFKSHTHCRLSPSFKITSVDISQRLYNNLFNS